MIRRFAHGLLIVAVTAAVGCSKKQEEMAESTPVKEADYIAVQHILIGFQGSVPGKNITRSREEAQQLAEDLFARAKAGEDFDALVKQYTDDSHPGIYKMANHGVQPDMANQVYPRGQMVAAFGDVGFPLAVGEVGLAVYDPQSSKYGWHVIKRVE